MRIPHLFIIILFIAALPNALLAGQSVGDESEETSADPECDYISVPEIL